MTSVNTISINTHIHTRLLQHPGAHVITKGRKEARGSSETSPVGVSGITLLIGLHGRLLTVLGIVSAHTTVVTRHSGILLGPRTAGAGNSIGCCIDRVEPPKSCHLLQTIAGLAPHDWVMHQSVCIWSLRQKKGKLVSIALMCLAEVAAIANGWQGEEGRDSVHWPGHWVGVIVTVELQVSIGPTAAPAPTRATRTRAHLLRRWWHHCPVSA